MADYLVALDQGTTSSRAVIFNLIGQNIATAQHPYKQIFPAPGWVEHDPLDILNSQYKALADAFATSGIAASDIAAIGITNQRETVMIWDRFTGKPYGNAIVWQCRRTAPLCERIKADGYTDYIRNTTGLVVDAYFSGTKIKWLLDNIPGARLAADNGRLLAGTVETWLIWNLTGGKVHITDHSNASRTMLFDINKLIWDKELCQYLDIPLDILPTPKSSAEIYGYVANDIPGLEDLAGIPISGSSGDQQAALFGQVCFNEGQAKNTYGTGCFALMNTGEKRIYSNKGLLSSIAWTINNKVIYALEGSVFNAGSAIQWLRDELGIINSASEVNELAASVADNGGVFFVPAFTGLGAPYWDMYARGMLIGLTRGSNKGHLARAVLESIAYQSTDILKMMEEESQVQIKDLKIDGGASLSDIMVSFQADMLGKRIIRPRNHEITAAGAAFLAGIGCGIYSDLADIETLPQPAMIFEPKMDQAKREKLYSSWQKAVKRCLDWVDK